MTPIRRLLPAALLLLPFLLAAARADVLVLTDGRPLEGGISRDDAGGVAFNPYFSRDPGMVFDVTVYPRDRVREVIRKDPPFVEYMKKSLAVAPDDAAARVELAAWCEEHDMDEAEEVELLRALRIDPENEAALRAFGRSKFERLARGNPDFDAAARAAIDEYLAIGDPEERGHAFGRLKREHSVDLDRELLDRIARSTHEPTGLQVDRALSLRADDSPGVYTLFVPKEYDARRPWPLIVGLHGGGPGGKDRDAVVGSGDSAMNFYIEEARRRGYLVVCPNAVTTPWAAGPNEAVLRAVIDEVELLYHVDRNRVYLTGHSMGGIGCWHYGPKWAEEFAAISPMAGGGGSGGVAKLADTNTPVFVFHGADDGVVGPDSDRQAARQLAKTKLDFVYTELDGVGHGFPESIRTFLFDFFDTRRLAPVRGRRAGPPSPRVRSSFEGKVGREEKRYLGDPTEFAFGAAAGAAVGWKELLKEMKLGGGRAEAAAERLGEAKDEGAVKPLSDLLRHPSTADDVRIQAARALGMIGHGDGYPGLKAALASENAEVVAAAAAAMAKIDAPKAGEALLGALASVVRTIDGKRVEGGKILFTDWERWLGALAVVVEGVGTKGADGGTAAIRSTAVKGVLAAGYEVLYSARVRQDPAVAKRRLALACVSAVAALDAPEKEEVLDEIAAAAGEDPAVASAVAGVR